LDVAINLPFYFRFVNLNPGFVMGVWYIAEVHNFHCGTIEGWG
jgi:hypothetical protein